LTVVGNPRRRPVGRALTAIPRAPATLKHQLLRVDTRVVSALQRFRSSPVDQAAHGVSWLGSEAVWGLLALWLLRLGRTQRWESVVGLVLVWGGAELLNSGLKQLVRRARPQPIQSIVLGQAYSFPSGHAMVAAAFYSFLAHRSWWILCGWQRVAGAVGWLVLILLIGLSRLYLGVHYFTDVVAGSLAGVLWTGAVIHGRRRLTQKRGGACTIASRRLRRLARLWRTHWE